MSWRENPRIAKHWSSLTSGIVQCNLCPRSCKIKSNNYGFCKVRGNIEGKLYTFNYGKGIAMTEELIETEAVNHYMPGARILSIGNIGCMFACDFCQNWETSQVAHLDSDLVQTFAPQDVVNTALENNIKILSWTYNDPVVWHEFVIDTAKLAKKHGLLNLYKSAFSITEEPVKELIEVMDIFSISFKSMDKDFYRKYCHGELQPVLDRVKQVYDAGKYLELSQLLVTDRNVDKEQIEESVDWIINNLSKQVPLHFVAFHPAYKYIDTCRTPKEVLYQARDIAIEKGIEYCYLGNIYVNGISNTECKSCHASLVERFGLSSKIVNLLETGECANCGLMSPIRLPEKALDKSLQFEDDFVEVRNREFNWSTEAECLHVAIPLNYHDQAVNKAIKIKVIRSNCQTVEYHILGNELISRIIVSRMSDMESGVSVLWDCDFDLEFMPVLDRAHFPTSEEIKDRKQE